MFLWANINCPEPWLQDNHWAITSVKTGIKVLRKHPTENACQK